MRFSFQRRVPFGHVDAAAIIYYPRYFEWFHDAFEAMFEPVVGAPYAQVVSEHGVGYPAVQVACEYRAPARWGDLLTVEVFLSSLKSRSATFEYRVRHDAVLCVSASIKIATMSMADQRGTPMPEAVRAAFVPYVEALDDELPDTSRIR
jgi:4-hydroxybenzoyl-CoA thioesterase